MAFTQASRVWWTTTDPGASTAFLVDATPDPALPASDDSDTGAEERPNKGRWFVCERSGFTVPFVETVIDPNTGSRVWHRFVDPPDPTAIGVDRPPSASAPVRPGEG